MARVGRIRSASRLVEMYRVGSMGAPEEAEIYRKVGTLWSMAVLARVIAV